MLPTGAQTLQMMTVTCFQLQARGSQNWEATSKKALLFHKHCVMPELCVNYYSNMKLAPSKVIDSNVDNSKTVKFCIC